MFRLLVATALGVGIFTPIFTPLALRAATDNQLAVLFGRPELELNLDGAVWRFTNEGNRGAFAKHPEVYAPRFAGYDPLAIGRGRSVQGHPLIWALAGQRLYLFYSEQTRASFLADPGRIIDYAERKWPARGLGQ
jgi:YHS domain-containing protein